MASNLAIISNTGTGTPTARAFGAQAAGSDQAEGAAGVTGIFAALVDNEASATPAEATAPVAPALAGATAAAKDAGLDVAKLLALNLDAGTDQKKQQDGSDATAVAGLGIPTVTPTEPTNPKPMVDLVEALSTLKASLDRGEPLDPKLVSNVEAKLRDLSKSLGIDLDTLPVPQDFKALIESTGTDQSGLTGALAQMLAPLAQSVASAALNTAPADAAAAPTAQDQLKSLGDKIGAMLEALQDDAVPADKLAALGMAKHSKLDPEIEAALQRFAAGAAASEKAVPQQPQLATPALKMPDPVLTASTAAPTTEAKSTPDAKSEKKLEVSDKPALRPEHTASRHDRAEATTKERPKADRDAVAPAAADASGQTVPTADTTAPQANSVRIDAAANPRIVQTGYQTSQQQLNLPQIAFELGRQVHEGKSRFQIRLDPPELGKIDVRLDIDTGGKVTARLMVEKAETLDLMQRDQRGLERALQQAGLDSAKTNLEFSLKQNPFAGQQAFGGNGDAQRGNGGASGTAGAQPEADEPAPLVNLYRGSLQASGVNIIA